MVLKTSEDVLAKKREFYLRNKEKILERKHSRQAEIYANKQERAIRDPNEWEKDQIRALTKLEYGTGELAPEVCEMCQKKSEYPLEQHHFSYTETNVSWLCKQCHAEADMLRRREE